MLNENVLITAIVCWTFKQVFFRWAEHLEKVRPRNARELDIIKDLDRSR